MLHLESFCHSISLFNMGIAASTIGNIVPPFLRIVKRTLRHCRLGKRTQFITLFPL